MPTTRTARTIRAALATVAAAAVLAACSPGRDATPIPVPSQSVQTPASLARFYGQPLQWRNCGDADCATVQVPVDYADPSGPTLDLAVTRVKAADDPIGSLFVNPGGPGGSAFDYARAADGIVGAGVRARFDIIGVDPRGVGKSSPVTCLTDAQRDALIAIDGTPEDPAGIAAITEASSLPLEGCAENAPDRIRAMSTRDAARDLDIVRALVGDPVLNYLGKSYGTYLGAAYAEQFPERVGRMVLDGVLAPGLGIVERTDAQAAGFEDQAADFARDCAESGECPFDGDGAAVLDQLRAWLRGLDEAPIRAGDRELTEGTATYAVLSYLYFPSEDYGRLRDALGAAVRDDDAAPLLSLLDARTNRGADGRYEDNSSDAYYAVTCLDVPFTGTQDEVAALARDWSKRYPTFGESLAWGLLSCSGWPAPNDDPITAVRADGSAPILVVGTAHDPATPLAWARELAGSMANARLLEWDGRNHTAYRQGSGCIDDAVDAYLLRGTLPADGTVCS